jgi:hypothetical protein
MAVPDMQLDTAGEIEWFYGRGPAPVLGPCRHDCKHARSLVAWGPSYDRYKLVECNGVRSGGGGTECAGRCRAWMDSWGNVVTDWLEIDVDPASVAWATRHRGRRAPLINARFEFWCCPVEMHSESRTNREGALVQTVEWVDDVAHCLFPGCGRNSADPDRNECVCNECDCSGACCGIGQCSCGDAR